MNYRYITASGRKHQFVDIIFFQKCSEQLDAFYCRIHTLSSALVFDNSGTACNQSGFAVKNIVVLLLYIHGNNIFCFKGFDYALSDFFSVFLRLNLITADKGFKIIQRYYCLVLDFFVHIVPVYFGFSAVSVNNFTVDSKTFQKTFGADVSSAFVLEFNKRFLLKITENAVP